MFRRTHRTCSVSSSGKRPSRRTARLLPFFALSCALLPAGFAGRANAPQSLPPQRVVIVGGGPNPQYNQVAIESNVRYVCRLLPPDWMRTTLFADGDKQRETVLYEEETKDLPAGEKVLGLLLEGTSGGTHSTYHYRKPNVGGSLDGASKRNDVGKVFTQLVSETAQSPAQPLLLYFTGHGSPNEGDKDNNGYDLWGDHDKLSVRDLAKQIARLPQSVPVTIIMVQCFSGSFGNLVFENGDPKGNVTDRDIAGYFATLKERVAAGCTPALNEAEYRDFTSYFFAALTGRDRVGRSVTGADYNGDGRVGMDEAYAYSLANDDSIDVPVSTSDVFLRRFVTMRDEDVFKTPYRNIFEWATPAQRAALDSLSTRLKLRGDRRGQEAFNREFNGGGDDLEGARESTHEAFRVFNEARETGRQFLFGRWPDLKHGGTQAYDKARAEAVAMLGRQVEEGKWDELLKGERMVDKTESDKYASELSEARLLRFVRLCKSVVLAHALHETGDAATKTRFARLIEAESRTPLPRADSLKSALPSTDGLAQLTNAPLAPCPCLEDHPR